MPAWPDPRGGIRRYQSFQARLAPNGQITAHGFAVQQFMQNYAIATNLADRLRTALVDAPGVAAKLGLFALSPLVPALV